MNKSELDPFGVPTQELEIDEWPPLQGERECSPSSPWYSDDGLALLFTKKYGNQLRFTASLDQWYWWAKTHWQCDDQLRVVELARQVCRQASTHCHPRLAAKIAGAQTIAAVERLARSDERHATHVEAWDPDPWLLNTPDGTIDLRTGSIGPHRSSDLITKCTLTGLGDSCARWSNYLHRVTDGDKQLEDFLQRVVGYCLTGVTREHAIFFLFGAGSNGKSVFLNSVSSLLKDYASVAAMETFMASNGDRHPTELAKLRAARLVIAVETEHGRQWAESKLKSMTGGDKVTARFMRQDFFEYVPQFKLMIAGNHKPALRSVDEAIRRRFHLIPFTVTIPAAERDPLLLEVLREEYPGILRWAVEGCLQWQKIGLCPPPAVLLATEEYLAGEDCFGRWLEERAVLGNQYQEASSALYFDWRNWCERNGEHSGSQKQFSQVLEQRCEITKTRNHAVRGFLGIGLK